MGMAIPESGTGVALADLVDDGGEEPMRRVGGGAFAGVKVPQSRQVETLEAGEDDASEVVGGQTAVEGKPLVRRGLKWGRAE